MMTGKNKYGQGNTRQRETDCETLPPPPPMRRHRWADGTSGGIGELDGTSRGISELDGTSGGIGELNGTSGGIGWAGRNQPRHRWAGRDQRRHRWAGRDQRRHRELDGTAEHRWAGRDQRRHGELAGTSGEGTGKLDGTSGGIDERTEPAEASVNWTEPAEASVSWTAPAEASMSWMGSAEASSSLRAAALSQQSTQHHHRPSLSGNPLPFLLPLGVAVRPGPVCWRCGDPGHFQDHCPMMEVGLLIRVPDSPGAAPDQAGHYQIPVSIKGGTYQALVDSGCNQTHG